MSAIFADFIGPQNYLEQIRGEPSAPPSGIHFFDEQGVFHARPFIYPIKLVDARSLAYEEVRSQAYPISFFARGSEHRLLGFIPTDLHLFGVESDGAESAPHFRLLGA